MGDIWPPLCNLAREEALRALLECGQAGGCVLFVRATRSECAARQDLHRRAAVELVFGVGGASFKMPPEAN